MKPVTAMPMLLTRPIMRAPFQTPLLPSSRLGQSLPSDLTLPVQNRASPLRSDALGMADNGIGVGGRGVARKERIGAEQTAGDATVSVPDPDGPPRQDASNNGGDNRQETDESV